MINDKNSVSTLGTVYLYVAQLKAQIKFYEETIGLKIQHETDNTVYMGVDGQQHLVGLIEKPHGRQYRGVTGLYHFALLVPTQRDLAHQLEHFRQIGTRLQGASDHIVSEAIYLADVEGNGIEIYHDKPRDAWYANGEMQIATLPLDIQGLMQQQDPNHVWEGLPSGTTMGHMHLHVQNVEQARQFYAAVMNLDTMFNFGSAAFMSYEDYHHHLGINNWNVHQLAPENALGLAYYDWYLPQARYKEVLENVTMAGVAVEATATGVMFADPFHNHVNVIAK